MTFTIYRLYDAAGNLLYVGKTNDFYTRLTFHQRPWYTGSTASWDIHDLIDHWTIVEVEGRAEAIEAEIAAIHREYPIYNRHRYSSDIPTGPLASRWRRPSADAGLLRAALAGFVR